MSLHLRVWILFLALGWIAGCASERDAEDEPAAALDSGELAIEAPWARPAPEGGMSALYLRIENGTATEDTLQAVRTDVANTVEIHESYENEDGMRGMRPFGPVRVPAHSQVALAPGGRHVMLIRLNRTLEVGDSLVADLQFARAGIRSVDVPVRMQPSPAP